MPYWLSCGLCVYFINVYEASCVVVHRCSTVFACCRLLFYIVCFVVVVHRSVFRCGCTPKCVSEKKLLACLRNLEASKLNSYSAFLLLQL